MRYLSLLFFIFCFFFFFFKQKTAYEMRISDWSSDVCSSDLPGEQREDYELQDIVERRCRSYAKVNATVRSPEIIQDLLKKGSSFYETVFDKGFLLYKNEGAELPFSVRPATTDRKSVV